ncbi:MAG: 7-carboxy-7-deazaguanine synthase QueE [Culturomica sp.]|jgi:organic radical activating enzyme|nr:7-carboxy-7-deazaguanine synthase QueE [Culturomica sp.]
MSHILKVKEIFYSLQGEGTRQGEASIFIRLSGCNLECEFCDTDFKGGTSMTRKDIYEKIKEYPCKWIVWTGGEPTLQLTKDIIQYFKYRGFRQAIESNGLRRLSEIFDHTVISPKGDYQYVKKHNSSADEVRVLLEYGQEPPLIKQLPKAKNYYLSPIFRKSKIETRKNIAHCIQEVKKNPTWQLSVQLHKLIGIK